MFKYMLMWRGAGRDILFILFRRKRASSDETFRKDEVKKMLRYLPLSTFRMSDGS